MYYYKLLIAYDGYDYQGWQWQPHGKGLVNQLERSFKRAFHQAPISLAGASRTDAGVHAWGQVARVKIPFCIEPETLKRAWQGTLPSDIMIRDAQLMPGDFDVHDSVVSKTYDYYVCRARVIPFLARYCVTYYEDFDKTLLQKNLDVFVGTHDFRSFCTGYDQENTVRTIHMIQVTHLKRYDLYRIRVTGPGFLRHMVRRIIGAALQAMTWQLEKKIKNGQTYLHTILEEKNPRQHLKTAPAHGLMLRLIMYGKDHGVRI